MSDTKLTNREKIAQYLKENSSKKFGPTELKGKNGIHVQRQTVHSHLNILKDAGFVKKIGNRYAWYTYNRLEDIVEETLDEELGKKKGEARSLNQIIAVVQDRYDVSEELPSREKVEVVVRRIAEEWGMNSLLK